MGQTEPNIFHKQKIGWISVSLIKPIEQTLPLLSEKPVRMPAGIWVPKSWDYNWS